MKVRLGLAAVCFVLAIGALLLARDAWHWEKAMRDADARATVDRAGQGSWDAATTFPGDPARSILGIDDDLAFRTMFMRGKTLSTQPPPDSGVSPRTPAEAALGSFVRTASDPRRSSQAANLLGVLLFTDADDPESSPAERALGAFQDAVLLDPANDVAKANLELVLRQLTSESPRGRTSPGGGNKGGQGGAGLAPPGKGY